MVNYRRWLEQTAKLQPKFVGPYLVVETMPNHTYKAERSGQVSIQNEARLKSYLASPDTIGEAPPLLEPRGQTTMRRRIRNGAEYEVVVLPDRDVVRDEQPPPLREVRPPPPAPALIPSLPKLVPAPDIGTPTSEEANKTQLSSHIWNLKKTTQSSA